MKKTIPILMCMIFLILPAFVASPESGFLDVMSPNPPSSITPYGPDIPTSQWNFQDGSYTGSIGYLGLENGVYTNYTFLPSRNGTLSWATNFTGSTTELGVTFKYEVELYSFATKRLVATSGVKSFTKTSIEYGSFSNLDKNTTYYVRLVNKCTVKDQYPKGTIVISQS